MQQGEVGLGQLARNFNFSPFLPDGSINYDSQAIMFDISFNQPTDYDFNTGVVNVNAHNSSSGLPQEHYTYTATRCKNIFSKGRFEQELNGKLIIGKAPPPANNGRPTTTSSATGSRPSPITAEQIVAEQNASFEYGTTVGSDQTRMLAEQDAGLVDGPPTPQPAAPPAAPESTGSIDYNAGLAGTDPGTTSSAPQEIAKDD
jgi:hypothetical protein